MKTVTVSKKGWIVIPADLRKKYHLEPGTKVMVMDFGDGVTLFPVPENPIEAFRGMFKDGPSLTEALLKERKGDIELEEAKFRRLFGGEKEM